MELLKDLPAPALACIVVGALWVIKTLLDGMGWAFKEWWDAKKKKEESKDKALSENTLAIVRLQVQIEKLNETLTMIPKLKADLDSAHEKIRDLQNVKL